MKLGNVCRDTAFTVCFEIIKFGIKTLNWNSMNCKLEKFWNKQDAAYKKRSREWTVNLKSFEISYRSRYF